MPALTPEFLFDLESNMRLISERDYDRLLSELWWHLITKELPSGAKKERLNWLLDTARIERTVGGGGEVSFEDILSRTTEYEAENASGGLELKREQMEDTDGNGVALAAHWARQMGAYAAYWPQKQVAKAIRDNGNTYDGLPFFSAIGAPHPVNPFKLAVGSYANHLTGVAAGSYPGALPIDDSITLDVAISNMSKVIAYVATIPTATGEDPRNLKVNKLFVPPALAARAQQLTGAQFVAQGAAGGAGSADVGPILRNWAMGEPVVMPELGAAFGGSDTDYFIAASEITSDELGAFVYVNREAFSMVMHGEMTDAQLARTRKLQWTTEGRNTVGYGHPYLFFKISAT